MPTATATPTPAATIEARRADLSRRRDALLAQRPSLALDGLTDPSAADQLAAIDLELADIDRQLADLVAAEQEAGRRAQVAQAERDAAAREQTQADLDLARLACGAELHAAEEAIEMAAVSLARALERAKAVDLARIALGQQPLALHAARIRISDRLLNLRRNAVNDGPLGSPQPLGAADVPV